MTRELRLELAEQRVRLAALESKVERLVTFISETSFARAVLEQSRREREIARRYSLIRAVAGFLGPGNIEATARQLERVYTRELPPPSGAEEFIARLRQAYGNGGPSRRTIRRALTESPNKCVNSLAEDNEDTTS